MSLEIHKGEGPKSKLGSSLRGVGASPAEYGTRPSVGGAKERLRLLVEKFSPTTIADIMREIERAKEKVGDDPNKIADLLEEGAKARTEAGKALKQGDLTLQEVIDAIRNADKPLN